jgi:Protein of unknown function (DUF3662)/FHA domain
VPNLRDFERRLGGLVEGLFAKTFRSGVQPVELAKRLIKEMDAGRTVGVNEVWAPNRFQFRLSTEDHARLEQAEAAIARELGSVIRENASERGWGLVGPPEVTFEVDEGLRRGDVECAASLVEGPEKVEPAPAPTPTLVVREDGGERTISLDGETATIGRLPACDVPLKDRGASRRHAQIRVKDGVATITDLGSTNGTEVNGHPVQTATLDDGDRITIGTTVLVFREA